MKLSCQPDTISDGACFVGYRYAGLQYEAECYCGNSGYDRYGVGDGCNHPCTGNSDQICGGDWRNSVYLIRKYNKKF